MNWTARAARWMGFVSRTGVLLLLPAPVGCETKRVEVSGKVVLPNGALLRAGRVTFRPADPRMNSVSAELTDEGTYKVVLPVGEAKVSIDNREWEPRGPRGGGIPKGLPPDVLKKLGGSARPDTPPPPAGESSTEKPAGKYLKINSRYYDIETSGLQLKVEGGSQTYDIELTK